MAIYNVSGSQLNAAYDVNGQSLSEAFDINGTKVFGSDLPDIVEGRTLIWHDEFDGTELDTAKWNKWYGLSSYETIYPEDNSDVAQVSDGELTFSSIKNYPYANADYSSAYIHTRERFEFRHGLIEAKIKFSSESRYHSTLWTLGANSYRLCTNEDVPWDSTVGMNFPSCGEIDIAEAYDNNYVDACSHWATAKDGTTRRSITAKRLTTDPDEWHIYGCEWTDETISFYCDRVLVGSWNISTATVNGYNPFMLPHYLIFNCLPYLSGSPTGNDVHHYCQWVRVYAPVGEGNTEATGITLNQQTMSLSVGGIGYLTATLTPSYVADMTTFWTTSDSSVCTCYGGKIIALKAGRATVMARTKNGYSATCEVTVS